MKSKAPASVGRLSGQFNSNCWSAVLAFTVVATPAFAHHSSNMFDMSKTVEVKGTVKEFHWTNPHSWVVVGTVDAAGKPVDYSFEANGPGYLVRNGWKRESLKPGDKVTITANPLRTGGSGGNLVTVLLPDGRELSAKVTGPTPYAADGPPKATGARQ
jgi:hypothetical protein